MTQIERISYYETLLDRLNEASAALENALAEFEAAQTAAEELAAYYESEVWRRDYEDDEAGRLPAGLRRGVLSEDAIYSALEERRELRERMP